MSGRFVTFSTKLTPVQYELLQAELNKVNAFIAKNVLPNVEEYAIYLEKGHMTKSLALQFGIIIGAIQTANP